MLHDVQPDKCGPLGPEMSQAISACVHCGYCLPSCPTYQLLGQEQDSPRGRIYLMKEVLEGKLDSAEVSQSINQCLGCTACETACPSGVKYGELLSGYRSQHQHRRGAWMQKIRDYMVQTTFADPDRFRWAIRFGRLLKPIARLIPTTFRPMLELLPDRLPKQVEWPAHVEAEGKL